jgi:hypothetical protein
MMHTPTRIIRIECATFTAKVHLLYIIIHCLAYLSIRLFEGISRTARLPIDVYASSYDGNGGISVGQTLPVRVRVRVPQKSLSHAYQYISLCWKMFFCSASYPVSSRDAIYPLKPCLTSQCLNNDISTKLCVYHNKRFSI